jgi:hypothetical protein
MAARWLSIAVAIAAVVVGCGDDSNDVDRRSYVKQNLALLKTVPVFPGARLGKVESVAYKASEQSDAIVGFGTIRSDALPARARPSAVVAFYRRELGREWRVVDISKAPSISLRKGDSYLHVLAGGGVVDVEVDHDCYKGGSSPVCFGP